MKKLFLALVIITVLVGAAIFGFNKYKEKKFEQETIDQISKAVKTQIIHIKNCDNNKIVADPIMAQVEPQGEVVWINDDTKAHIIKIDDQSTGEIKPGGEGKINVSLQRGIWGYICDSAGGQTPALYVL